VRRAVYLGLVLLAALAANAQTTTPMTTSALGSHDLGAGGTSPIVGGLPACYFCHAPHNGVAGTQVGLWSQKLSTVQNYTLYPQTQLTNTVEEPTMGDQSNVCLSCHDGTIAPGQTQPWGPIHMSGSMQTQDVFGTNLSTVHPFNFKLPLQMPPDQNLIPSVVSSGVTLNPDVKMPGGNVQCTTCHNPHVQSLDSSNAFLVVDNTDSALCLACHVSSPASGGNTMASKGMPLLGPSEIQGGGANQASMTRRNYSGLSTWRDSAHAQAAQIAAIGSNVGSHRTVRKNGCESCHSMHKAEAGEALLSAPKQALVNVDAVSQNCLNCHNGGSTVSPPIANIYEEIAKKGHPFPTASNQHTLNESALLNKNRHATCVDCHNPHASEKTTSFLITTIRPAESGANGISAQDGVSVVSPAVNQYEVCLRCHGTSTGKQQLAIYGYFPTRIDTTGDPLDLVPQLSSRAISSHPVTHDRMSRYPQPSLLKFMWNLDGHTQGRAMGSRILCTDCHNSDDNRESGGQGPNGPHGSQYDHILERRYEYSQVAAAAGPGSAVQNLLPAVIDPTANGPYSLCAKCHDLSNILSDASFRKHSVHINAGFSCSVCHTAHGVAKSSVGLFGDRLVNFDLKIVARNDASHAPISYDRTTNTCTLKCHNYNHNQNGTVTRSQGGTNIVDVPTLPGSVRH
jgi:predicted CXXCH cytochrome family protein